MRMGRSITCFSLPHLENFRRNSMGSWCRTRFFSGLMIFCTLSGIRGLLQVSFVWCLQDRVKNVFLNNCLNWEGLRNAHSGAKWQLHSYLAALNSGTTRRLVATPCASCMCLTLKSTCVVKCWRNARCFHGVIFSSRCAKFLWASALVYRCLNFSPSELVSVCWKWKAFSLLAVAWGGWTTWSKVPSNSNLICFYDTCVGRFL